jgi:hypothetical protein
MFVVIPRLWAIIYIHECYSRAWFDDGESRIAASPDLSDIPVFAD